MTNHIETDSGADLEVQNLVKYFGNDRAVDDISFSIPKGAFLTLLGPSGCGKTTTLMSIAGLHSIDAGRIRVGDVVYTSPAEGLLLPPEQRDIGMVFQSYAIWPHMTVAQNVAYPLEIRKVDRSEIDDRVASVLKLVGLTAEADKLATNLSGGQQQRASWRVPSWPSPDCCCSMSRSPTSISSCASRCVLSSSVFRTKWVSHRSM